MSFHTNFKNHFAGKSVIHLSLFLIGKSRNCGSVWVKILLLMKFIFFQKILLLPPLQIYGL